MKLKKITISLLSVLMSTSLGFAQSYKVVINPSAGELENCIGGEWDKIDSIVVVGTINKADFKTLYNCARFGKLTVINLEKANTVDNKIPAFAIYYPDVTYDYLNVQRIILPDNIIEIGQYAFSRMRLQKINFPTSLKKLSNGTFKDCRWLAMEPLIIPEGIEEIPQLCFSGCQSFKKVILPKSLKKLAAFSFLNAEMEEICIPDGLETIGNNAFEGAIKLRKVILPESAVNIGDYVFFDNQNLESIQLSLGMTEIPTYFLNACYKLSTINIPDNVTCIKDNAFEADFALSYIRIPKNLRSIGSNAFRATDIVETVLPETLESIGADAFSQLERLERVYCMAKVPPTAELNNQNEGPFYLSAKNRTLYVPKGTADLYLSASGWQDFKEVIETDNFPSSIGITFASNCIVTAGSGMIQVTNLKDKPVVIRVYSINGTLIKQDKVNDRLSIEVLPGVYIVKAEDKTYKIVIE